VAKFAAKDYWDKSDDDANWHVLVVRKLIDEVIHAAGR